MVTSGNTDEMKCRVGGKRERMHGTKDTLIRNCGKIEMGIKVKRSRNDNGGWWERRRYAE